MRWLRVLTTSILVFGASNSVSAECETQTETRCAHGNASDIAGPSSAEECKAACQTLACNWIASEERCEGMTELASMTSDSDSTCFTCVDTPFLGDDKNVVLTGNNPFGRIQLPSMNLGALDEWTIGVRVYVDNFVGSWSRIFDFKNSGSLPGGDGIVLSNVDGNIMRFATRKNNQRVVVMDIPLMPTDQWVWVMVSYNNVTGYSISFDGEVVKETQIVTRLRDINLDLPYLGQSHYDNNADANVRFSYFFLSNKSHNSSQGSQMIAMRGALTSADDVLQAYDYHNLATYSKDSGFGAKLNNIDMMVRGRKDQYSTWDDVAYATDKCEVVDMTLNFGFPFDAHECRGQLDDRADFKLDLRGTPYKIKGLPSSLKGQTTVIEKTDNNDRVFGPFKVYGWRTKAVITCDSEGQYCYGSCGGYCGGCSFNNIANGNRNYLQLEWVTNGGVLLACNGDYYAENHYCKECTVCGNEEYETRTCSWNHNRTCASCEKFDNCTAIQCTNANDSSCLGCEQGFDFDYNGQCTANWLESLAGLKCGETHIDIANFWTMISGRPHIDIHDGDDGVVQFKVGSVKSKGLEVVLVDKDSTFVDPETNKPIGVEIFIGSQEEPVIHISESVGDAPAKFADITDTPVFSAQANVLSNVWIRALGSNISVGTGVYGESSSATLLSHDLSTPKTINRAIMTYGYGDLECEPLPFEMNIMAGDYSFEPVENWAQDASYLPYTDRSYTAIGIPESLNDTIALKSEIRFKLGTTTTVTGYGTLYYAASCPSERCGEINVQLREQGFEQLPRTFKISNDAVFEVYGRVLKNETVTVENRNSGIDTDQVGNWFWAPRVDPRKVSPPPMILN